MSDVINKEVNVTLNEREIHIILSALLPEAQLALEIGGEGCRAKLADLAAIERKLKKALLD